NDPVLKLGARRWALGAAFSHCERSEAIHSFRSKLQASRFKLCFRLPASSYLLALTIKNFAFIFIFPWVPLPKILVLVFLKTVFFRSYLYFLADFAGFVAKKVYVALLTFIQHCR
ncbi:MAG: hypothetical protein ACTHY5_11540, partial [Oceanisphaera sp.]|uniref:hypothetical protein n=1 Tax=Oceanisphaera sp. TaxID=1929979 RepID=UPI003F9E8398